MSIVIRGMEMPENCCECEIEGHYENSYGDEYGFFCPFGYKAYTSETRDSRRLDDCPLVEVPSHGRLIDADELNVYDISPVYGFSVMGVTEEDIIQASTIIPASGGKEDE